jgi:hypothetical protein
MITEFNLREGSRYITLGYDDDTGEFIYEIIDHVKVKADDLHYKKAEMYQDMIDRQLEMFKRWQVRDFYTIDINEHLNSEVEE